MRSRPAQSQSSSSVLRQVYLLSSASSPSRAIVDALSRPRELFLRLAFSCHFRCVGFLFVAPSVSFGPIYGTSTSASVWIRHRQNTLVAMAALIIHCMQTQPKRPPSPLDTLVVAVAVSASHSSIGSSLCVFALICMRDDCMCGSRKSL